jgi:hypothetical protein
MLMIASFSLLDIEQLWMEATAVGFHQVTKLESCVKGPHGLCILDMDSAGSPTADGALERFLLENVGGEIGVGCISTMRRLFFPRLPSDQSLRSEWNNWVRGVGDGRERSLAEQKAGKLDGEMIDQALQDANEKVFSASARKKRQREFEKMCKNATTPQDTITAPKVEVGAAPQETIRQCEATFKVLNHFSDKIAYLETVTREGLLRDGLPPVAWDALERATSPKDDEAVVALLKAIVSAVAKGTDDAQKHNRLVLLAGADPALFLPFCRPKPVTQEKRGALLDDLVAALESRFFGRSDLVKTVAVNLARRLAGDQTVLTLLLHGPPGTGKSFLVTQLAEALTEAGIAANTVFQAMTEGGSFRGDEQVLFQLTGTAAHYSNADCGSLYRGVKSSQHRLSLVLLDEAEKCTQRDFLVNLLDPRLPLEDSYIKGLVESVDLRPKTVFFLSANDTAPLCQGIDDPLWSRLQPAWLRPYSREELEEILVRKVRAESPFDPGKKAVQRTVKTHLDRDGGKSSLRKLLDEVNCELFLLSLDRPDLLKTARQPPAVAPQRSIGFCQ